MRVLRRLFPLLFILCLASGAVHLTMTGTIAESLVQGSIRDALAARSAADLQTPVQEARRYLGVHEAVTDRLRFLAPDPDKSGIAAVDLRLTAVDIFVREIGPASEEKAMRFAATQLGEARSFRLGVWRPGQARASAAIFWILFALTIAGGLGRLRSRPPAAPEPQGDATPKEDPA